MLGNNFNPNVTMADLTALVTEAGERRTEAVMRVTPNIQTLANIPDLQAQYEHLIGLYTTISNLRAEREETVKDVSRKTKLFMAELNAVRREMESTEEYDFSGSVIRDFLEQVSDLRRKSATSEP